VKNILIVEVKVISKQKYFVDRVIEICSKEDPNARRIRAKLRRLDNPNTEYQGWDFLSEFIDLTSSDRPIFSLIAASIAKDSISQDGNLNIGGSIAVCYQKEGAQNSEQASRKLRRLLACKDQQELCQILRSILSLIRSKCTGKLSYTRLLEDLIWFSPEKTPARWAQGFFGFSYEGDE
jgi:CRISPR system Cascade subunit CasB